MDCFEFELREVGNKSNPSYVFPVKKEYIKDGRIIVGKKIKLIEVEDE